MQVICLGPPDTPEAAEAARLTERGMPCQEDTLRHLLQLQTPIAGEAVAILESKRPQSPLLEGQVSSYGNILD